MRNRLAAKILTIPQLHNYFKENAMDIPSINDLFNATDTDGWTIDERIEQHINETLKTVLNPEQVDTLQLAGDLTDTIVASLKVTDLNAYAHDQEQGR